MGLFARIGNIFSNSKENFSLSNSQSSDLARSLLKEATALKKEKKYIQACEKLREAYSSNDSENLMIEDRLRLPMYLQLAGKNDEGWDELNRLLKKYIDPYSPPIISHQMKVFLKKENNESALNPVRVISQVDNKLQKKKVTESKSVKYFELQNAPLPEWMTDDFSGVEFEATMQLRTPLRVLLHHGEHYTKNDGRQPKIAHELWEGIWTPKAKPLPTYREFGIDVDEVEDISASHIGPIEVKEYLPFLIEVRKIVELNSSIKSRIKMLQEKPKVGIWKTYVNKHGGINKIIEEFFPRFIDTIPKINSAITSELHTRNLNTPNNITTASDELLIGIKGVGKAKLKVIRDYCATITSNRDGLRLEILTR